MAELEQTFTLFSPKDHINYIVGRAPYLDERFWGQWMYYHLGEEDGNTSILHKSLTWSAGRVEVILNIDGFTHTMTDGVPNYLDRLPVRLHNFESRESQRYRNGRAEQELKRFGATWVDVNPAKGIKQHILPPLGRNHIKMVIQDGQGWILDVNVSDTDFSRPGAEILISDQQAVETLAAQFPRVNDDRLRDDKRFDLTQDTELIVDAGNPGSSKILDTTIAMVNRSKDSVLQGTPFLPDGILLKALNEAYGRGVKVDFVTANQSKVDDLFLKLVGLRSRLLMRGMLLPISYHPDWMHAKYLIIDDKELLMGSHNFTESGVKGGTTEIALHSTNRRLIQQMIEFHNGLKKDIDSK